ncbi:hypothetical protein H6F67_03400 [Microcoleus sp. FACHB-1515]|uniref:hypothetical protein n=1 Tax=Cyanophyceae TaxID=3028117 RepID=UPI0016850A98|nr:hypothetical protein [Microcoleus sp. FACHB-1515]MBD2088896.1 hypothetical protein [Microcoleus sp. FACHB-1515]
MKQIPRPNAAVWRSIAICTTAGLVIIIDNQYAPTEPVQANGYQYSKVDQHCISAIDRTASIPQDIAAQVRALPAFTPVQQVIAQTGPRVYCEIAPKSIRTPNGPIFGNVYVLPIEGTSEAVIGYVDEFGQWLGSEVWNLAPDRMPTPEQRSIDYFLQPGNVDRSILPYDRRNLPAQPDQQPAQPAQPPECR